MKTGLLLRNGHPPEPHIIKELVVGKSYTLTENQAGLMDMPLRESITFTVENTAEIQKQIMEDDVTKVEISKTDITEIMISKEPN